VVPVKGFDEGKQRLAQILSAQERSALCRAMLADVLDVLCGHPLIDEVLLVSDDPAVKEVASERAIACWSEVAMGVRGLNPAVNAAAQRLRDEGIGTLMVVHGDLPCLSKEVVRRLIERHHEHALPAVTIAPDSVGEGSNIVLVSPPTAISFRFGPHSFQHHSAPMAGVAVTTFFCQDSCADIDTPADLHELIRRSPEGKQSFDYLLRSGIVARLAGDRREIAPRGQQ